MVALLLALAAQTSPLPSADDLADAFNRSKGKVRVVLEPPKPGTDSPG